MQKSELNVGKMHAPGGAFSPSILHALPYFMPIAALPLLVCAAAYGGWWLVGPFAFLWLTDQFDSLSGLDERNMALTKQKDPSLLWYKLAVNIWAGLYPIVFIYAFWQIFAPDHLALWEDALIVLALGVMARMTLNVGHDMMHRTSVLERRYAEFLMASVSFAQEVTEHFYIHHVHIGTPHDSLTPAKGQSFWQYLPRSVGRSYLDAWRFERDRMVRRGMSVWHYANPIWRYALEMAVWYGLAFWIGGIWGILVFIAVCAMGIFQLRMADYIQHYGLQRVREKNGRYERIHTRHTWTAAFRLSNWLYYNSQRHADHHIKPARPYPMLQHCRDDASPQLPGSYGAMGNLIMSPRRWFAKMDPLVDQWRKRFYPEIDHWNVYDSAAYWARPEDFGVIAEVFEASPLLSAYIDRNPAVLDSVRAREFTDIDLPERFKADEQFGMLGRSGLARVYWTYEFDCTEMKSRIADIPAQNAQESVEAVHDWSNDKAFQVCMHMLRGNLTAVEAGAAFANIAEASIVSVLSAVDQEFSERQAAGELAAVLLGDLASGDAAPGTEPGLMFVWDSERVEDYEARRRRSHAALRDLCRDHLLFAPMPHDGEMPASCSLESLRQRHQGADAPVAELLQLARARLVFTGGDGDVSEEFDEVRHDVLSGSSARDALIARILETPAYADQPKRLAVDDNRGGRRDLDRAVRYLQLMHGAEVSGLLVPDAASVFAAAGAGGVIGADAAARLAEAATMWRALRNILRLVAEDGVSADTASPQAMAIIAQACGAEDIDALAGMVDALAERAASEVSALIDR